MTFTCNLLNQQTQISGIHKLYFDHGDNSTTLVFVEYDIVCEYVHVHDLPTLVLYYYKYYIE